MSFSSNLEYLMKYYGVSNYRLSKYISTSQTSVKNWLSGERLPHAKTQKQIAELFGVTVEEMHADANPHIKGENVLPKSKESPASDEAERPECWDLLTREEREKAREYIEMLIAARGKR